MSEAIGVAQVGVGYWGKNLLRNLTALSEARVLRVCDQDPEMRTHVARRYPSLACTGVYEDVLADPAVEAVFIATETDRHFSLAEAALVAGKHVFVEKPMTRTVDEAERLVALAEANNRRLMVGHLLLYHPAFRYVERLIASGELGDVYYLYAVRVNLGIIRQSENALESLAPHDLAVALQFLGERPTAVSAQGQAYLQEGIEDVAFLTVFFENGKMAHLHASWLDPHKIRKVTVVGNRKMAVIDDMEETEKVRLYDKGVDVRPGELRYTDYAQAMQVRSGDIHIPRIEMQEPLRLECAHFLSCVRSGATPRSNGRQGLVVMRLLDAAHRSLRAQGARISL